jgi:hypothetical protein
VGSWIVLLCSVKTIHETTRKLKSPCPCILTGFCISLSLRNLGVLCVSAVKFPAKDSPPRRRGRGGGAESSAASLKSFSRGGDSGNIARTMANKNDFNQVFAKLKGILQPYVKKMDVAQDSPTYYLLNTRYLMKNKQPLCFGGVRLGKAYVSFYLMSVYASPDLLKSMSPELKKRMQGKSCFNFKEVDEPLFKELARLTKAGASKFSDGKFIEQLRAMQGSH